MARPCEGRVVTLHLGEWPLIAMTVKYRGWISPRRMRRAEVEGEEEEW